MPFEIHPLSPADWPSVRDIYAEGIATGNATFENSRPIGKSGTPRISMAAALWQVRTAPSPDGPR
jgi:L-amino acid N-acyltransferase YncA